MKRLLISFFAITAVLSTAYAEVQTFNIDSAHSSVGFKIRHLFSKVPGRFTNYEGTFQYDAKNPQKSSVEVTINAASVNTDNEKRDDHLRSKDFFWTEKYPKITFKSTEVLPVKNKKDQLKVRGDLTIRGVTKPVTLNVNVLGVGKDPWDNEKASFEAETEVNRKDFDINWNETLDKGGYLLGDKVEIEIGIEGTLEKDSKKKS